MFLFADTNFIIVANNFIKFYSTILNYLLTLYGTILRVTATDSRSGSTVNLGAFLPIVKVGGMASTL